MTTQKLTLHDPHALLAWKLSVLWCILVVGVWCGGCVQGIWHGVLGCDVFGVVCLCVCACVLDMWACVRMRIKFLCASMWCVGFKSLAGAHGVSGMSCCACV